MQYSKSILDTIGKTPLVKLNKVVAEIPALVLAKVESFNPGNSIKDRMAVKMIENAEANGSLKPGGTIIETTSRNIEMGLVLAANVKGYQLICVVSDKKSKDKIDILRAMGAKVIVCSADVVPTHANSSFSISKSLSEEIPNSWFINQQDYESSFTYYQQTASEIWEQTEGKITHFVSVVKTGETILGIGKYLKEKNPNIKILGIDKEDSPTNADFSLIDDLVKVTAEYALYYQQKLTLAEGIIVGKSSGAAIKGLLQIKEQFKPEDVIVVLFHD
jgi:cystathionine beta-synthase